jgi:hypothetical protein
MAKSVSAGQGPGRLSSWPIVASGFVAYLGLVFALALGQIELRLPLPWWGVQLAAPALCAALVFLVARPPSAAALIGGTLLMWAAHLLIGVLTEAFVTAFSRPGAFEAAPGFPPPLLPALLCAALLLAPLRERFKASGRARRVTSTPERRPASERRPGSERRPASERRPGSERRIPAMSPASSGRPAGQRPTPAPPIRPADPPPVAPAAPEHPERVVAPPPPAAPEPGAPPASTVSRGAPETKRPSGGDVPVEDPLIGDLLARDTSDEPVLISFARIAQQLPAELCSAPLDRVAGELERPGHLLVPRRLALGQLVQGVVRAPWELVASQFPAHLLQMTSEEVAARLPGGKLVLPIDEIVRQFPTALFMPSGPPPDVRGIESFPEPFQPMAGGVAPGVSPTDTDASQPAPVPEEPLSAAPSGTALQPAEVHGGPVLEVSDRAPTEPMGDVPGAFDERPTGGVPHAIHARAIVDAPDAGDAEASVGEPEASRDSGSGPAPDEPASPAATDPREPAGEVPEVRTGGREAEWAPASDVATRPASLHRDGIAVARRLAAGLAPLGSFEVGVRTVDGMDLFSMSRAGLDEDVARSARLVLPLLSDGRAPWAVDQVTLRGARAAVVLTPLGRLGPGGPVLAAAVRPEGALALLELRSREAAAAYLTGALEDGRGDAVASDDLEEPDLLDVEPSTRVHEVAASSLGALGTVAARALRDAEAGRALYLFLPPGSDARAVGAFADQVARALRGPDAAGLDIQSVVLRSGTRRMIIRLPVAGSGGGDTIVAAGETARPGLAYRQVEQAALALGVL